MLAGSLHVLVLGIPLQLQTLSAETPAQFPLHAMLQTLNPAETVQAVPVPTHTVPTEKKPAKAIPLAKPEKQIISSQSDTASTQFTAAPVVHSSTPSGQEVQASPANNIHAAQAVSPRFNAAYLNNPRPTYPPLSRRLNESGKVLLKVRVSEDGRAIAVDIAQSSNSARLDEAARQAVSQWRFIPAKLGEQAIVADVIVPIVFKLDD